MLSGIPIALETGLVGLAVAVVGAIVSVMVSGQPITWPVIVSAVVAAGLNYFTSSARAGEGNVPGPTNPSNPSSPNSGDAW